MTYAENSVREPWLTKDLFKLVRFKHYLFRQYSLDILPFYIYNSFKNILDFRIHFNLFLTGIEVSFSF